LASDLTPAEAKKLLAAVLDRGDVFSERSAVRDDMLALRLGFAGDDVAFAEALRQTALEIMRALKSPDTWGDELGYGLTGWRRSKYSPARGAEADLRLVFRARDGGGIDLNAFAHRRSYDAEGNPTSAYFIAKRRA
jgi:hypothetical protein